MVTFLHCLAKKGSLAAYGMLLFLTFFGVVGFLGPSFFVVAAASVAAAGVGERTSLVSVEKFVGAFAGKPL